MAEAGKAPSHTLKVVTVISSSYNAAIKRGKVSLNPATMIDPPELGEPEDSNFTDKARAILRTARNQRNFARWSFGLSCGVRQGEALGLRWAYVVARCENCGRVGPLRDSWDDPRSLPARGGKAAASSSARSRRSGRTIAHKGTHAARHTAATLLLDQGVALAVVHEMLGHSGIRVTRATPTSRPS